MKNLTILTSLFSILATVFLMSCSSDKPVTSTTTTTSETAVRPAPVQQTTTTNSTRY